MFDSCLSEFDAGGVRGKFNGLLKLDRYGSTQLWRDTLRDFASASPLLPEYLGPLADQMRQTGRALEQESVWLPVR